MPGNSAGIERRADPRFAGRAADIPEWRSSNCSRPRRDAVGPQLIAATVAAELYGSYAAGAAFQFYTSIAPTELTHLHCSACRAKGRHERAATRGPQRRRRI